MLAKAAILLASLVKFPILVIFYGVHFDCRKPRSKLAEGLFGDLGVLLSWLCDTHRTEMNRIP